MFDSTTRVQYDVNVRKDGTVELELRIRHGGETGETWIEVTQELVDELQAALN